MEKKVFILGIDGGEWSIINKLIEKNKLPNFKRMKKNGVSSALVTIPPWTPAMWTSLSTGKWLENHGIYSFLKIDSFYNFIPVNSHDKKAKDIWNFLPGDSIVLNVPITYPADKDTKMISGMLSPTVNTHSVSDPDLLKEVREFGRYKIEPSSDLEDIKTTLENRITFTKRILEKDSDWKLGITVLRSTDPLQHKYWDLEIFESIYKRIDGFIEWFNENYPDAYLFVVSDHGFRKVNKEFSIPKILKESSFLELKSTYEENISKKILDQANVLLNKIKDFFPMVKRVINLLLSKGSEFRTLLDHINFRKTTVFPGGWGELYINRRQIFEKGKISINKESKIIEEIKRALKKMKDSQNNKKIINNFYVVKKKQSEKAPSLYYIPNTEAGYCASLSVNKNIISRTDRKGEHHSPGIFLAEGPNIKKNTKIDEVETVDIVPTCLHILGIDPKCKFDGKILHEILEKA